MISETMLLVFVILFMMMMMTVWMSYLAHLFYRYVAGVDPPKEAAAQARLLEGIFEAVTPPNPFGRTFIREDENQPPIRP